MEFVTVFDFIIPPEFHRIGMTYALKITSDHEIRLEEHDECKWFKLDNLPGNMIPGPIEDAYSKIFGK